MGIGVSGVGVEGIGSTSPFAPVTVTIPSRAFIFTPNAPVIAINEVLPIPSVTFNFVANPPTIRTGPSIQVPSKSFIFTTPPPTIVSNETLPVPSVSFNFTAFPPNIGTAENIIIPSKSFTFAANPPTILFDSALLERTVNIACTGEAFIILLSIEHPNLAQPARISNDPTQLLPVAQVRGTISNGEEFIYLPFEFLFPNQEADTSPVAQIRIDNISREISTIIDSLSSPPTIQIQVVLSSTPDIVELELLDFKLRRTEWNILTVTGDITVEHFEQEPFPAGRFNPSGFPGLFSN